MRKRIKSNLSTDEIVHNIEHTILQVVCNKSYVKFKVDDIYDERKQRYNKRLLCNIIKKIFYLL